MRRRGVSAELAGLLVMVADGGAALETNWIALAAIALTLSLLLLLVAYRSNRWALVPLLPVALATGWSALVLFLLPISLNPWTAGLAALAVGFGGAVAVVLSAGYRERREQGGRPPADPQAGFLRLVRQPPRDCFGPGRRSSPPACWRLSRATSTRCDSSGGWRWWTSGLSAPASRWCCRRRSCGLSSAARCRCACHSRAQRWLPRCARGWPGRARCPPPHDRRAGTGEIPGPRARSLLRGQGAQEVVRGANAHGGAGGDAEAKGSVPSDRSRTFLEGDQARPRSYLNDDAPQNALPTSPTTGRATAAHASAFSRSSSSGMSSPRTSRSCAGRRAPTRWSSACSSWY